MTIDHGPALTFRSTTHVEVPFTGAERRPFQQAHLRHIATLLSDGALLAAGALADGSGSILLFDATPERARALIEEDPYSASGVWGDPELREFLYASPSTS
jgi:uncharacterized protein